MYAAPASNDSSSISLNAIWGMTATRSAKQPPSVMNATRSPFAKPEPSGAEPTTPAPSEPSTNGGSGLYWYSAARHQQIGKRDPGGLDLDGHRAVELRLVDVGHDGRVGAVQLVTWTAFISLVAGRSSLVGVRARV